MKSSQHKFVMGQREGRRNEEKLLLKGGILGKAFFVCIGYLFCWKKIADNFSQSCLSFFFSGWNEHIWSMSVNRKYSVVLKKIKLLDQKLSRESRFASSKKVFFVFKTFKRLILVWKLVWNYLKEIFNRTHSIFPNTLKNF